MFCQLLFGGTPATPFPYINCVKTVIFISRTSHFFISTKMRLSTFSSAILAAVSAQNLPPLKCFTCWAYSIDECIRVGSVVECNKNQESCMLVERKKGDQVISVRQNFFAKNKNILKFKKFNSIILK